MGAEWVVAAAGRASRRIAAAGRVDLQEEKRRPQTEGLAPVYAEFTLKVCSSCGDYWHISGQKEVYLHSVAHAA